MARAEAAFCNGQVKEAAKDIKKALSLDKDFSGKFQEMLKDNDPDPDPDQDASDLDEKDIIQSDNDLDNF